MPYPRRTVQLLEVKGKPRSPERPRSRDSSYTTSSGRSANTTGLKKESAVLTDGSLDLLARELSGEQNINYILLAMYLNTPTIAIVNAMSCMQDDSNATKRDVAIRLLLEWKNKKSPTVKEKDKVRQLERALKEMGKTEWADLLMEKHTSNMELTAEALAQS